ncbi:lactose-binding lectin l-2-like isoform X2 [Dunckerocampus dactyliophorus]|nr:lactose-binding lectin l-2-like isoform X2 [Dunckerocampus dactyliophorus]XP_054609038.1 lactose-binding lectin l-2-like isoform X2 [Dunckerocampus dactyliophorus]XP_054609039.1 lactose-binding lectin l-2-like isoform X2 [Dunckerocampus dactyliophorus]XP_054609040.1 lactose-binding lectin l-2-like isoform X2 [Dunckerocampus dactyliophorus]XP_054609041.1 lactose-binding lectin l-2-like isoform X2 [Dunckerocampus dactyliophorus]XP_054609042.1 lactose-binding lectin l-2-like isoform X2 [Duncke
MQSKLDMAGKKPPKAFILQVATIRLTFVIGLIFIAMPLAEAVKGVRLNESTIERGTSLLTTDKAGNSQDLTGYMTMIVQEFQKLKEQMTEQTGQMKKMTSKVEEMTDESKDLLMKAGCCTLPWQYHDKRCYLYVKEWETWDDAQNYCVAKGGRLASVHTKATYDFLIGLAGSSQDTWVGGHKENQEWKWIDGSTFRVKEDGEADSKVARWGSGEPNNVGDNENCVDIRKEGLNDSPCSTTRPFLCQL